MSEKDKQKQGKLRRELGLTSVIFFLFGYIVGAGILIQIGTAAAQTGPGLWLAFIIAGIPHVISAIIVYYIVSAFPVSGGAWVYSSRLLSPIMGFLVLVSLMIHIIGSLAFISVGFGIYVEDYIPGSRFLVAILVLGIFYIINILGVKIAGWIQVVLAIFGDFLILILFIIFGFPNINLDNLVGIGTGGSGMFPNGFIGVFIGAVILSFSYAGFTAIVEIGGEIKNPKRTIPLGLFISLIMVMGFYILVSIIMTGVLNYSELQAGESTLIDVFINIGISGGFLIFLNILILIAIASTLHGVILAYSRDLFSAARDKVLPSFLSDVNKRFGTPHWAVSFFCISSIILLIFQPNYIDLQYLNSLTIAIPTIILAFIPFLLEKKYPELIEKSKFKIKRKYLLILVIFNVAYSLLSIFAIIGVKLYIVILTLSLYVIALIYFFVRKGYLEKRGYKLEEICKEIPEETLEVI